MTIRESLREAAMADDPWTHLDITTAIIASTFHDNVFMPGSVRAFEFRLFLLFVAEAL